MIGWIKRSVQVMLLLCVILLTGCLQYDLNIQFDSQTHGQFVQQLHWRGGAIAPNSTLAPWLQALTERTEAIGGKLQMLGEDTLEITVPFNNGKDLETRFNRFFKPSTEAFPLTLPSGEPIQAELSIQQGNWLMAIYNHIRLTFDLTAIRDLTETGFPLLQGTQLLEGRIVLTTPWGLKSPTLDLSTKDSWILTVGEVNQIEADFWVPSPIGIGAAAIALFILIGYAFKYWPPQK